MSVGSSDQSPGSNVKRLKMSIPPMRLLQTLTRNSESDQSLGSNVRASKLSLPARDFVPTSILNSRGDPQVSRSWGRSCFNGKLRVLGWLRLSDDFLLGLTVADWQCSPERWQPIVICNVIVERQLPLRDAARGIALGSTRRRWYRSSPKGSRLCSELLSRTT